MMGNDPPFVSKYFAALCAAIGTTLITTLERHAQANGQMERFNKTLEVRLQHYINEHQTTWDTYMKPLTYGHNTQIHRTTNASPFSMVLDREPPGAIVSKKTIAPKE